MNINNFNQHFHSQPSSFYDSLLSLEKFIDKKHAFDDFAHLVFKAPLFEDLMAVVSVYTSAFGPMSDREVAMVQKRMYQLNRQTVRAMHEIINQKQLIAGINSKETNIAFSGVTKTPPGNSLFGLNTTPLPNNGILGNSSPMTPRHTTQPFGSFHSHHNELPTTILNTPVHTPTGPDRFLNNKPASVGKALDFNDRPSMTVQELLRIQQNWASNVLNNATSQRMNENPSLHTPTTPSSMSMMDNGIGNFFMSPTPSHQTPMFSSIINDRLTDRPMIFGAGGGAIVDDSGKIRNQSNAKTTRRRSRSETAFEM